jgi:hypothetical protein
VNAHCATKEAALTGLQRVINFVMHDDGLWLGRLGCVPLAFGAVQPPFA